MNSTHITLESAGSEPKGSSLLNIKTICQYRKVHRVWMKDILASGFFL
jgi:hypothetical protein